MKVRQWNSRSPKGRRDFKPRTSRSCRNVRLPARTTCEWRGREYSIGRSDCADPISRVSNEAAWQGLLISCDRREIRETRVHIYHIQPRICREARPLPGRSGPLLSKVAEGTWFGYF